MQFNEKIRSAAYLIALFGGIGICRAFFFVTVKEIRIICRPAAAEWRLV